ncbi:MAG: thiosulfate oxidation carrier complex protein SoxZ [Candidatus Rokuibacteriota bacterium]|nr:MAG: thiosulfate oxidation carrier complex protein SoxZ [Candidatus Rokubacteria bacterium]
MANALVNVPARARRGEIIEIKTLIRQFVCTYNGTEVFRAELHPAIAANPFFVFSTVATESGTLTFQWTGDNGFSAAETTTISVD